MKKGYVQIYTGNGKGKTTAALGLTLRALGAGLKVFIGQFLKQGDYSEIKALGHYSNIYKDQITIEQYGSGRFIKGKPTDEEKAEGKEGYSKIHEILKKGEHDLVIVEEGNVAMMCNIISENDLLQLMDIKQTHVELVITGRGATEKLIEKADLVTEMKEIKHYYAQGVSARTGIEK
ncbi:MAG: cob(I)yrinic acid a,c-diamide adenosyltransferase [Desulfobacteraceae bacterium]|nr:cob(I)yrinic acid a,c-diamide adenosyltransferase [Desulfobacteraceae bacterium]